MELLPELLEVTGTLCENLKTWYERYLCELDAAVTKSASEREADKVMRQFPLLLSLPKWWLSEN